MKAMMYRKWWLSSLLMVCAVAMLAAVPVAWGFPKPSPVSASWKLDFTFQKPQAISFTDANGNTQWYWFMAYKVVNNTDADQLFVPDVTVANNAGRIVHAGQDVPVGLYGKIKKRLGNPLLLGPMDVVGNLRQGKDFAKQSVAIWPAANKDMESFKVFVAGLSGETATITDPVTGKNVLLRRSLMIDFQLPGVYATPEHQPVVLKSKTDVMR